MTKKRK